MIYIYSHDITFSEKILNLVDKGEFFSDEARLASAIHDTKPDCIIFDMRSGSRPLKLLKRIYIESPSIIILLIQPQLGISEEIYVDHEMFWPVEPEEVVDTFHNISNKRKLLSKSKIIGRSKELMEAAEVIDKVADSDINVLITGPSGAGKEIIAKAVHNQSRRADNKFIAVNVAAMAPGIIESELFGHEKGAFTGAASRRIGVFEQAENGTIFLDEIGEIPLEIQAKLLRVLETRSFTRVGGNTEIKAEFRLLAATNRMLSEDVANGKFREDLFYRLSVVSIELPELMERKGDISPLVHYFLENRKKELKTEELSIEPGALRMFYRYDWPGNVRELKNVIDSFTVTSKMGKIKTEEFEKYVKERRPKSEFLPMVTGRSPEGAERQLILQAIMALTNEIRDLRNIILSELERVGSPHTIEETTTSDNYSSMKLEDVERELIIKALGESGGNRKRAARLLGMGERTLYRKLEKYGLK
jgi:DNA-binding NtrC family response regulator